MSVADDGDVYDIGRNTIPPLSDDDIPFDEEFDTRDSSTVIVEIAADGLPGEPLTGEHTVYLLDQGVSEDYLDQPHVAETLRSITSYAQLPEAFRWGVTEDAPTGILFGHRDPATDKVVWQFRPDYPVDRKYVFPEGCGSPVALRSAPLTTTPAAHTVLVTEGTKQPMAVASAVAHDPRIVVVGISGCHGGLAHNRLAPGIAHVTKGASKVVLIPDADAASNPDVYAAMDKLGKAIRARTTKRRAVMFAQVPALTGEHSGIDDVLATVPPLERFAFMQQLIEDAIPTPADARPTRRDREQDEDTSKFFSPFDGGLKAKTCAEAVQGAHEFAIDIESGVLHTFDADLGLYVKDPGAGEQRVSTVVKDDLTRLLGEHFRDQFVSTVESVIRANLRAEGRQIPPVPDTDGMLPVANGLLDMENGRLVPHSPDYFITAKLAVAYDPTATCPEFDAWLPVATQLADGTNQVDIVLDALTGLLDTCAGLAAPDRALYLYGVTRGGKGTLGNNIIAALVPDGYRSSMSLADMAKDRPVENAKLHRKLLNISGETSENTVHDFAVFKRSLGGDYISGELKFGRLWDFKSRAFQVHMGNDLPHFNDISGAVGARLCPVGFQNSNEGSEDRGIGARLTAELPGILNRIIAAWKARQARGGQFLPPANLAVQAFTEATNPVAMFVADRLDIAPDSAWRGATTVDPEWGSTKTELYTAYRAYTTSVGTHPLKRENFVKALTRKPFLVRSGQTAGTRKEVLGCRLRREDADSGIAMSMGDGTVDVAVGAAQMAQAHAKAVTDRVIGDWRHLRDQDDDPDEDTGDHGGNGGGTTPPEPIPPTPTPAPSSDDEPPHPALARMGAEFWATMQRVGRVLPRPVITADMPLVRQRYEEAKYATACSSLMAGVTLTDLAVMLDLPPSHARGYIRAVQQVLVQHGVTLLERRLGTTRDTLGADRDYLGEYTPKSVKAELETAVRAAKAEVSSATRAHKAAIRVHAAAVKALTKGEAALTKNPDADVDLDALKDAVTEADCEVESRLGVLESATIAATEAVDTQQIRESLPPYFLGYAVILDPAYLPKGI